MKTIGIIAGNGRFPILTAQRARREGYQVNICAVEREADPILKDMADAFQWVKIGELKKLSKFFRANGVHEALMAGKIEKVRLFGQNVRPDLEMVKMVASLRDFKDESLLGGIAKFLHEEGVDLLDSTIFMKDAMPAAGLLSRKKPSHEIEEDIRFGFELARHVADLDIGQTVAVKKKAVIAVEAIEGTDLTIRRAGELSGGDLTVVKVARPKQDMRFDVPAVGMNTLKVLREAKARAFAFEANKTIFLDLEEFLQAANQQGMVVMGVEHGKV